MGSRRFKSGCQPAREPSSPIETNVPIFSVASLWEIAIKSGLNRQDFEVISQARVEGIMLLTNDKILGKYGRPVRLA
jgi:PIN domain nuclease of toxin-antitoxin system